MTSGWKTREVLLCSMVLRPDRQVQNNITFHVLEYLLQFPYIHGFGLCVIGTYSPTSTGTCHASISVGSKIVEVDK